MKRPEHFVYVIDANGYPFYVGHGGIGRRQGRLAMRSGFIDGLVRNHPDRNYSKWTHHGKVVAELWERGIEVLFDRVTKGDLEKREAAAVEKRLMQQLLDEGILLSNVTGNRGVRSVDEIVAAVLTSRLNHRLTQEYLERFTRNARAEGVSV